MSHTILGLRAIARHPILVVLALLIGASGCHSSSPSPQAQSPSSRSRPSTPEPRAIVRPARVLLLGDSILDQEGSAAAFLLRQWGADAKAIGVWGSGLIGIDQYDYGKTKPSGYWLHRAKTEVDAFRPDVVGVYMNHSYWPPYPHDATGNRITDLSSASGQTMIAQQARALIGILRAHGAKVFFITPAPVATTGNPDPGASNPIWHGYVPVLRAMHVMIADTAQTIETAGGLRAETQPSCAGTPARVRPPADVHLTRFGAGLAGSALARFVAGLVHLNLGGNAAPGDAVAALVPTRSTRGYWLVGCDGSVFHFGDAPPQPGVPAEMARHGGAVAAVATPSGSGFWVVAADGTIASVGGAPPLALAAHTGGPIVAAAALAHDNGLWAVTASGAVSTAGRARTYPGPRVSGNIVGIAATPDGRGYWLVNRAGRVFANGSAQLLGSARRSDQPNIAGLAATTNGRGYWLVDDDGRVFANGSARPLGNGTWPRPPGPGGANIAAPGPMIGIVATGGAEGYWIVGTTGRVVGRGAARAYGGDNNLALETQ